MAYGPGEAWSLLNLMMSLTALFAGLLSLYTLIRKKKEPEYTEQDLTVAEDEEEGMPLLTKPVFRRRRPGLKIALTVSGIIPGLLFLLLEDITLPVTWVTQWTPIIGAFFLISMAMLACELFLTKRVDSAIPLEDGELERLREDFITET